MLERTDFSRAMVGSVLLHGGVIVALLVSGMFAKPLPVGGIVPVTIVSDSKITDLRAAQAAPQEQTAQTEEPVPDAPAPPAAIEPTPQPRPTPLPPTPTPKPAVDPFAKGPKPPARPVEKSLDLDALAASVNRMAKAGGKTSSAAKGAARPETALEAREAAGAGKGLSAIQMAGLAGELQRRWNPNCDVEGGRDVKVRVIFTLGPGGQVVGQVSAGGLEQSPNPVVKAAADRAIRAVHQAAPFSAQYGGAFGQKVTVNFNAREACS
jgi:outer membrane biosynthesis protein TonB